MKAKLTTTSFALLAHLVGMAVLAGDGTWTNLTTGVWSDAAQWQGGIVGGGTGSEIVIAPGFGGARKDDRFLQVPDEGVTLGTLRYRTGDPVGAIRIWGGPLVFASPGGHSYLYGTSGALNLLAGIEGTDTIEFYNVTVASRAAHTGDTVISGWLNLYGNTYADTPSLASTNGLPPTRITLKGGAGITSTSRGSWDAFSANFTLTEGSRMVVCATALSKGIGAKISGEGIAEGTWLKAAITEYELELSQPATKTGTFSLQVEGAPSWLESVQQVRELALEGRGGLLLNNFQSSANRWEVDELIGHGTLAKSGAGSLLVGAGSSFTGSVTVSGPIEIKKTDTTTLRLDALRIENGSISVLDADMTIAVGTLAGTGTVVKTGLGSISAAAYPDGERFSEFDIREGSVVLGGENGICSACPVRDAWFHVDASRADTLTTVMENGTNFVTRWDDADGGTVYATAGTRPFVNTNAFGGRATIDFGSYHYPSEGVVGYGGYMNWSATDTKIREVFVVCSDTEDIAEIPSTLIGNFLLGDSNGFNFHRGLNRSLFISHTSAEIRNGLIEVDGVARGMDYPLSAGFHLVHLRTTGNVKANAFSRNRSYGYGGQRIAEVLVYNRELSEKEAGLVAEYLNQKWFGDSYVRFADRLVVSGSSAISVGAGSSLGVGALVVGGRMEKWGDGAVCADTLTIDGTGVVVVAEGVVMGGTNAFSSVAGRLNVADGAGVGASAGTTFDVMDLSGEGTLVKEGGGTVNIYGLSDGFTSVDVRGGTLVLPARTTASGAWFHVDASRADTLTTVVENGTNFVTRWNDADGGNVYATAGTRPFVNTNAIAGRATIDFGSYHYPSGGVTGYGGYMNWSATDTSIREVFVVCSDTEDIAELPDTMTGNFLLGDSGNYYNFHRGLNRSLFISHTSAAIRNGLIEVDGTVRAMDYPLPAGFHLVHLRTTGNVRANAFARNRSFGYGGQRIAEALVYNRTLSDAEARSATFGLLGKWLGSGIPSARAFDTLQVSEDATLDLSGMSVTVTNLLCCGTIRAASLAAETMYVSSDATGIAGFTLDGVFAAGNPGMVVVDGRMFQKSAVGKVFDIATVEGCSDTAALARWRVAGPAIPPSCTGRLDLLDGNRLVLRLNANGLYFIMR